MTSAASMHAALAGRWPSVLVALGIDGARLVNRHGPCPACGGRDRFRFDDRRGRGDFFCNGCGPGDGFALLQRVHGWSFRETAKRVEEAAGLDWVIPNPTRSTEQPIAEAAPASPTHRVRALRRECSRIEDSGPVSAYLASRGLLPLPADCTLRAHAGVDYWHEKQRIARFPALVADVRDIDGELVTVHVTYLHQGAKLASHEPRKILSPLTGRIGCAARLMPLDGVTLGIAEGIETALAAAKLHGVPTWASLNAGLLAKFEPPEGVQRLIVFADRDVAGFEAAARLMERLQGRCALELRVPRESAKDFADQLTAGGAGQETVR